MKKTFRINWADVFVSVLFGAAIASVCIWFFILLSVGA